MAVSRNHNRAMHIKFDLEHFINDPFLKMQVDRFYQIRKVERSLPKARLRWLAMGILSWQRSLGGCPKVYVGEQRLNIPIYNLYFTILICGNSEYTLEVNELPHSMLEMKIRKSDAIQWSHTVEIGEGGYTGEYKGNFSTRLRVRQSPNPAFRY